MSAPGEAPPEDPVKRETSMTAAVLLRRSLVDKQMVDTEATIKSYEARQDDTKAQIIRRRNAQAEVYAFVNKRLEENFDSIAQLETSINAAEAEGREARRRFAEEEAAARSANAREIHAHDGEVERCDGERKALEAFAAERGGLTAHLVAVHARCELVEEERRAAERSFLGSCEADRKMLTREAAEAAAQARKVALEDAKQKLDKTTRRRIGELSRMKKELALHASESAKLETANAALKSKVDALSASLRSVRRDHKDLAKRTSTRRRKERGDRELQQAEDRDAKTRETRERTASALAAEDVVRDAAIAALRAELDEASAERDDAAREAAALRGVHATTSGDQDFEVAALFVAAKHALPPAPRPRTQQIALPKTRGSSSRTPKTRGAPRTAGGFYASEANKLPRSKRDDFVELLFSHLYQMQQIQFQEQAEAERRAELLAARRACAGPPLVDGSVADSLSVLSSATEKFGFDEASLGSASLDVATISSGGDRSVPPSSRSRESGGSSALPQSVASGKTTGAMTAETAAVPHQSDVMSLLSVEERSYMSQSLDEGHSVGELDVDSLVKGAEKTALLRGHTPGSPLGSKRDKPPPGHSKLASSS
ncbi:plastid-lipid associated protein / fibrillin family protein [Aureococcus anophagefferens]|uniref:Cilia- and flagella-associated protein 157 n=1 Tax=Aureococcus anophagefferens TaxID=44056 RepID=A0ABR1GBY0_AURAN